MISRSKWEQADVWRKHRCIIFLIRYFLKQKNYSPFFDFKFDDYKQRVRVVRTYEERFMDLSDVVEDEPSWGAQEEELDGVGQPAASAASSVVRGSDGPAMEWDDDLNDFVEVNHVSSLILSCVLMCMEICPYTTKRVSLLMCACVLTHVCMCPHSYARVSLRRLSRKTNQHQKNPSERKKHPAAQRKKRRSLRRPANIWNPSLLLPQVLRPTWKRLLLPLQRRGGNTGKNPSIPPRKARRGSSRHQRKILRNLDASRHYSCLNIGFFFLFTDYILLSLLLYL